MSEDVLFAVAFFNDCGVHIAKHGVVRGMRFKTFLRRCRCRKGARSIVASWSSRLRHRNPRPSASVETGRDTGPIPADGRLVGGKAVQWVPTSLEVLERLGTRLSGCLALAA